MSENDRIILKAVLAEQKTAKAPELSDNAYFEIFTAEHILKNFDLSYDGLCLKSSYFQVVLGQLALLP